MVCFTIRAASWLMSPVMCQNMLERTGNRSFHSSSNYTTTQSRTRLTKRNPPATIDDEYAARARGVGPHLFAEPHCTEPTE